MIFESNLVRLFYTKRVGRKRCNYVVKFRGKSGLFEFGMIKYFISINDIVFAAVTQFKTVGNIIDKIAGRTSNALIGIKNSGVFNQFFSEIKEIKDSVDFIESTKLLSKCILIKTSSPNKYLISELIIEN